MSDSSSYPSFLLEVCDHDNDSNVLLPDHPPEVLPARSEWPLSCDVGPCSLITLQRKTQFSQVDTSICLWQGGQKHTYIHKVSVDVVPTFPISVQTVGELHSAVVIWVKKKLIYQFHHFWLL